MSLESVPQSRAAAFLQSDIFYRFRSSKITIAAFLITLFIVMAAILAPWIAPHNPFDVSTLSLWDSELPPVWTEEGDPRFLLGTDNQGRDVLSAILYGSRISLAVGFVSVAFAMVIGIIVGLVSGYFGGAVDAFFMRIADVMLSFPTILVALLVSGIARGVLPREMHDSAALVVLVFAITITTWVQYARTVRSSTMVERSREYVYAAQLVGRRPLCHPVPAHPAQRDGAGAGDRHHQPGDGHLDRGDAVVPRRGHAADQSVAGYADPGGQRIPVLRRVVGGDFPLADTGGAGPGRQPAG